MPSNNGSKEVFTTIYRLCTDCKVREGGGAIEITTEFEPLPHYVQPEGFKGAVDKKKSYHCTLGVINCAKIDDLDRLERRRLSKVSYHGEAENPLD
jgi:hypothetical protein